MNKFDVSKVVKNKLESIYKQSKKLNICSKRFISALYSIYFNLTVMIKKCGEYRSLFRISISAFTVLR